MIFFSKYNKAGVFNQSEIGNKHATNFQNKMYIKFQKIQKQKKSLDLVKQKLVKLIKIEKTEELIAQYQEGECLWYVLFPWYKDRNLRQMALTNPSKKFDISDTILETAIESGCGKRCS